jgi:hypothetical protein
MPFRTLGEQDLRARMHTRTNLHTHTHMNSADARTYWDLTILPYDPFDGHLLYDFFCHYLDHRYLHRHGHLIHTNNPRISECPVHQSAQASASACACICMFMCVYRCLCVCARIRAHSRQRKIRTDSPTGLLSCSDEGSVVAAICNPVYGI